MSGIKHRVKPELRFSPARSGDEVYYVVEDCAQHRFWRIGLLEYEICSSLNGEHSISSAIARLTKQSRRGAAAGVGQLGVIGSWLLHIGLIEVIGCDSEDNACQPPKPPADKSKPAGLFDPSFFRIPVFSSETIDKWSNEMTWLISIPCLVAAAIIWCIAIIMAFQNGESLLALGRKLFVPGSQWWMLVAWLILKIVHEAGHAIACARVGAKSNGAGIGFMFFAPSPFVDVTNLWSVPNRWSRLLVSSAGMLFEVTLAAASIICACTIENSVIKYLCFTIATLGTFTTLAFNGNPLMRYDGYYILIDSINRPNLWQDASQSMKAYFSSWICRGNSSNSWSTPLMLYGVCSWISRMLLIMTMGWGMWMTWDGAGLVVVAFFASLWFIIPQIRRMKGTPNSIQVLSLRNLLSPICPVKAARGLGIVGILAFCSLLPSPIQIYWPAIVEFVEPSDVRTNAPGFVAEVLVHDGQGVQAGDEILRLSNPDLELECQTAQSALKASEEKCIALRAQHKHSELQAEEALRESFVVKANSLQSKVNSLRLRAPNDGVLVSRMTRNLAGSFVPEGQSIGMVVDPAKIEINASIPQYAWETVARNVDAPVSVSMYNGDKWKGRILKTLPRTSDTLASPSLGGIYGGPITVVRSNAPNGESVLKTDKPRLHTRIELTEPAPSSNRYFVASHNVPPPPGALCSVKLELQNEAVWQTGVRWIRAALQTQFQEAR